MKVRLPLMATGIVAAVLLLIGQNRALPPRRRRRLHIQRRDLGQTHSCAITPPVALSSVGAGNVEGQLGIGTDGSSPTTKARSPLPVCASGSWNGTTCSGRSGIQRSVRHFSGSWAKSYLSDHRLAHPQIAGYNSDGQVGNGTTTTPDREPRCSLCQSTSSSCNSTYHFLAGIVGIAAGVRHTCAVDSAGYAWCWGNNTSGELGDGTTVSRSTATESVPPAQARIAPMVRS